MASPDLEKLLRVHDDQDNVNTSAHKVTKRSRKLVFACLVLLTVLALTVPFYGLTCRTLRDNARAAAIRPGFRHATPHGSFRGGSSQPAVLIDAARDDGVRQKSIDDSAVLDGRDASDAATADAAAPTVLECFQVAQPVLMPDGPATSDGLRTEDGDGGRRGGAESCTVQLMDHVFAWSYGKPFVGEYVPPSCDFNRVVINFTVVSEGVQYDRLALMYFGDTEVWRTSTAEPTAHPGIRWVYLKDMTEYLYFWKSPQKLIFDLGNLVDDRYTGTFNTTLTATFFTSDVDSGNAPPSDLIIPVSAHKSGTNEPSAFTVPESEATDTVQFPQNANRAVFSVSACGQAAEEFWWQNLLQSDIWAFNATTGDAFPGYSPFREVQVYIDGQLAGVQWPFPVIFTGGVVPSFHRPIVGLDAFDLREHEIDITPWLPLLCDGAPHTFTMRVAGVDDDNGKNPTLTKTVLSNWVLSGKIFVWLDDEGSVTTGSKPAIMGELPAIQLSHALGKNATGSNETLRYITNVKRTFGVSAQVASQKSSGIASWSQDLSYSNRGRVTGFGFNQVNDVSIEGKDRTSGLYSYGSSYSYPLSCGQTYSVSDEGNLTIQATLYQGLRLQVSGSSVFPTGLEAFAAEGEFAGGSLLETHRYGQAAYNRWGNQKRSTGSGHTNQVFRFGGLASGGTAGGSEGVELYFRNVTAVNDTVVFNEEKVAGAPETVSSAPPSPLPADSNFRGLFAQVPTRGQRASMAVKGSAGVGRGAPADGSTPQLGIEQSPMRR